MTVRELVKTFDNDFYYSMAIYLNKKEVGNYGVINDKYFEDYTLIKIYGNYEIIKEWHYEKNYKLWLKKC